MTKAQSQRLHVKNVLTEDQYMDLLKAAEITCGRPLKLGMFISDISRQYAKVVKELTEPYIDVTTTHLFEALPGGNIKAKAREVSREG